MTQPTAKISKAMCEDLETRPRNGQPLENRPSYAEYAMKGGRRGFRVQDELRIDPDWAVKMKQNEHDCARNDESNGPPETLSSSFLNRYDPVDSFSE